MLRVLYLNPYLGGAQTGVQLGADVADCPGEGLAGECVELNICVLAEMDVGEIVLVDVADDPDVGEIGDGEGAGGASEGDAGGTEGGDVLRDDDAAGGSVDLDGLAGMVLVHAEGLQLLLGGGEVCLCIVLTILRGFELGFWDGSLVVEKFVAIQGYGG